MEIMPDEEVTFLRNIIKSYLFLDALIPVSLD